MDLFCLFLQIQSMPQVADLYINRPLAWHSVGVSKRESLAGIRGQEHENTCSVLPTCQDTSVGQDLPQKALSGSKSLVLSSWLSPPAPKGLEGSQLILVWGMSLSLGGLLTPASTYGNGLFI